MKNQKKMQVKEFAEATHVSVRTLHYYDKIGLLKPAGVDESSGYRYYDENSMARMQEILFYKELDFSLKSIGNIISSPNYDKGKALEKQKELLLLKKERLENIIKSLEDYQRGEINMKAFENSQYEKVRSQYEEEAKQRWGETEAYKEYVEKSKDHSRGNMNQIVEGLNEVFKGFAQAKTEGEEPTGEQAQKFVKELQQYISDNFYNCTKEILAGLGQMYVMDERFRNNIDQNGEGTAEFASEAIKEYCKK